MIAQIDRQRMGEQGFTLPELLIAMLVTSIVLGTIVSALVMALRASGAASDRLATASDSELLVSYVVPDLQSAEEFGAVVVAYCPQLSGYDVQIGGPGFAVGYRLDVPRVIRWVGTTDGTSCTFTREHVVAEHVADISVAPDGSTVTIESVSGQTYDVSATQRLETMP